jgi:two-component system, NarL family, sensor histidine kinase UhpB
MARAGTASSRRELRSPHEIRGRENEEETLRFPRLRALLRVPLFYKILFANAVIVGGTAVLATLLAAHLLRDASDASLLTLLAPLAVAALLLSVTVNALILRLALEPVKVLERTAARVREGDLDARVALSPVADRQLTHVGATFNAMLVSISAYRAQLREMAARALQAEEMERKRIARELHDDTAQTLAALLIRLRVVRSMTDSAEQDAALDDIRAEIARALEGVHRYARGLRPAALDDLGLVPAVETHARMLSEAVGLPIRIESDRLDGLLSSDAELALYRIIQEALSNVVRHSGGTRALVRFEHRGDELHVSIEDDGHGFAVDRILRTEGRGLGLFGMRERAAYTGGDVRIESEPASGTRVRVRIPVAERERSVGAPSPP